MIDYLPVSHGPIKSVGQFVEDFGSVTRRFQQVEDPSLVR